MLGLPQRYSLARMSDGRCSRATSGVYSATESDCSNSPELYTNQAKSDYVQSSRGHTLGAPHGRRKTEEQLTQNTQNNINLVKKYVSRIPPPKPVRYHFQKSSTNLSYSRPSSDKENLVKNIQTISRIPQNKNKSASYMNINRKESHILV